MHDYFYGLMSHVIPQAIRIALTVSVARLKVSGTPSAPSPESDTHRGHPGHIDTASAEQHNTSDTE